jgi:uncharacterized repeat protein (TIGR01451 family)
VILLRDGEADDEPVGPQLSDIGAGGWRFGACTGSHVVTQDDVDAGVVVNRASVTATPPIGDPIPPALSNEVTVAGVQAPALSIVKASTATAVGAAGAVIPYTFTLTNIGNVTITGVAVNDPNAAGIVCPVSTPGARRGDGLHRDPHGGPGRCRCRSGGEHGDGCGGRT